MREATVFGKGAKTRVVLVPQPLWGQLMSLPRSSNAVFVSRTGRPLERTMVFKIVKQCAQRAGVSEKASCHWLRHSHASHAIESGCNLRLLQQSLGHSKLETTERYLHISPDQGSSQFIDIWTVVRRAQKFLCALCSETCLGFSYHSTKFGGEHKQTVLGTEKLCSVQKNCALSNCLCSEVNLPLF